MAEAKVSMVAVVRLAFVKLAFARAALVMVMRRTARI
jgi:hypothetical protein